MAEACAEVQAPAGSTASTGAPVRNAHLAQPASADMQDGARSKLAHQGAPQAQQGSRVPLQGEHAPGGALQQVNQQSQQVSSKAQHGDSGHGPGADPQQGKQQAQQGRSEPQATAGSGADGGAPQRAQQGSRELHAGSDRATPADANRSLDGVLDEQQRRADAEPWRYVVLYLCISLEFC